MLRKGKLKQARTLIIRLGYATDETQVFQDGRTLVYDKLRDSCASRAEAHC